MKPRHVKLKHQRGAAVISIPLSALLLQLSVKETLRDATISTLWRPICKYIGQRNEKSCVICGLHYLGVHCSRHLKCNWRSVRGFSVARGPRRIVPTSPSRFDDQLGA
jgi:hypothetical protein